jgi:hypothetical protein
VDVCENPVGSVDIVLRDVFPNLVEIGERIRMKSVANANGYFVFRRCPAMS